MGRSADAPAPPYAAGRESGDRRTIRARLFDFYTWCAQVDVPEVHTLAALIETWWPAVLTFLHTGVTSAATEGTKRLIK